MKYYMTRLIRLLPPFLRRNILLRREQEKHPCKNFLSVCAIVKNEGPYFKEWIEYHKLLGVDKFYVYDNESTDETFEVLKPYIEKGVVEYSFWPGKLQQKPAYKDCINRFKNDSEWIAFTDLDEFIVPMRPPLPGGFGAASCESIPDFLRKLPRAATQLCIGWTNYASSGHETKPAGLVIENFRHTTGGLPVYGKSIVNPRDVARASVHKHKMTWGDSVDENGDVIEWYEFSTGGKLRRGFQTDKIRVNHYRIKSWEEYNAKYARGGNAATPGEPKYTRARFDRYNINKHLDETMDKYVAKLKQITGGGG
ncbi:MAG: glycosyltransferase family 92 protein [Alphaproteobacteria bacterium]|nr:glycosyltransferase family 92 protein [Alphaproteobacteria bacterium]